MMYLSIAVAALSMIVVGSLRYSPLLFGNIWMKEMKIKAKDMKEMDGMWKLYLVQFILALIQVCIFAFAIEYFAIASYKELVKVVIMGWLAFLAIPMAGGMIWEQKSATLFVINAFHYIVAIVVAVMILYAMMNMSV